MPPLNHSPDVGAESANRGVPRRMYGLAVSLGLLATVTLVVADGCGPSNSYPLNHGAPVPSWLARPFPAPTASHSAGVNPLPLTVANPAAKTFNPNQIVAVLDEPALASVKAAVERKAYKGAADQLKQWLKDHPPKPAREPAYYYQLGLLRLEAGDPMSAIHAFDVAAAAKWPLSDYARWMAADLLVNVGEPKEAKARLELIPSGLAIAGRVALVKARALAASRDVDAAAVIWRQYLARRPRPRHWQLVALRFTKALLNLPSVAHAEEAVNVARQVIYESPGGRGVGEARELEQRALSTIPSARRKPLKNPAAVELMYRARALGEAKQGRATLKAAKQVIDKLPDDQPSEMACEGYIARGRGLYKLRRYAEASDAFGTAAERCAGHPRQVYALFLGGRAAYRGGRPARARQRFKLLEKRFSSHSFADDARLYRAMAARKLGDEAGFTRLLSRIADDYPKGDMVDEGLFTLARANIERGDWAGAIAPLQRAIKLKQRGRPYYAEGRPQYFLARAQLALGATRKGLELMASVIREFPMTYYMALAYSRLAHRDPTVPARLMNEAQLAEPVGHFVIPDSPLLHQPAFVRAVELVRQGQGALALAELDSLGVRDKTAAPAVLWASAFLLARIEAPAESHGLLRATTGRWAQHYPAGVWREVWQVAYPRPYRKLVKAQAKRFGLDEALVYGIMREESAFKPRVKSHANAYGLMQLIVPTARSMARPLNLPSKPEDLKRPEVNIPLGCRFLGILKGKFPYNPVLAIPGYNAGPGAPKKWVKKRPNEEFDLFVERIPYRETRRYTKRVIASMAAYAVLYGRGMDMPLLRLPLRVKPQTP